MEPADDVKLGDRFAVSASRLLDALVDRELVATRLVHFLGPRAQGAVDPAQVRRVEVAVDVVEGGIAVSPFADVVREASQPEKVARFEETHAVFEGKTLARNDFPSDRSEVGTAERRGEPIRGVEPAQGMAGFVTGW